MNLRRVGSRGTLEGQTLSRTQNSPSLGLHIACQGLSAFGASSFSVAPWHLSVTDICHMCWLLTPQPVHSTRSLSGGPVVHRRVTGGLNCADLSWEPPPFFKLLNVVFFSQQKPDSGFDESYPNTRKQHLDLNYLYM